MKDNPIEYFIFHVLSEWYETLSFLDFIRIPMIYLEYLLTILCGFEDFDPENPTIQIMYRMTVFPAIWLLFFLVRPFLATFMPIILAIYYINPSLFQREIWVFEEGKYDKDTNSMTEDELLKMIEDHKRTDTDSHSLGKKVNEWDEKQGRTKKQVNIAKPGLPTLLAKLYQ